MKISQKDWNNYVNKLSKLNTKAADEMKKWAEKNGTNDINAVINYAYGLSTKYGEGAAALAAEMYDAVAEASGANVPAAEPAETPTYGEVAKTVNGTIKQSPNYNTLSDAVGRLVKRTGADTTLKNAKRDGAQFAWIPHGDTCAFCITLASRGWQYMSRTALKGDHAEHIHANCDCTYGIRFNENTNVDGYDPEVYADMYYGAEGNSPTDKINSMRRKQYQYKKDKINAQKREAYKIRREAEGFKVHPYGQETRKDITRHYIDNANPGSGKFNKEERFKNINGEEEMAEWLHDKMFGGDIVLLADSNPDGEYNPDYLWNGKLWDLKSPTSSKKSTIEKRIKHGIDQIENNAGGVIIDITKSKADIDFVIEIIDRVASHRAKNGTVFIIKDGDEFKALQY